MSALIVYLFAFLDKTFKFSPALVTHPCNPSYSGSRDQEDRGSKPAWANSSRDPILGEEKE
jgi:hypothetical protein